MAIAAGASHSIAVKQDGNSWVWGNNTDGQLGDGKAYAIRQVNFGFNAPTGLTITSQTNSSVTLKWTASMGNVGVTGYDIFDGTTMIGSVNDSLTTYTVSGLVENKVYRFTVKAKNEWGDISTASNIVMYGKYSNIKLKYIYDYSGRLKYITDAETSEVLQKYEYDNNGNSLNNVDH